MSVLSIPQELTQETSFWDFGRKNKLLKGRLVHPNGDPLSAQKVKAFVKIWFLKFDIGEFVTDKTGSFHLRYKWWVIPFFKSEDILFRIYEEKIFCHGGGLAKGPERKVAEVVMTTPSNTLIKDLETTAISLYEYEEDFPDLKVPDNIEERPQHWPYLKELLVAGADEKVKDFLISKTHAPLTIEKIHELYGPGDPDLTTSPESTIEMLLNGVFPCYFKNGANQNERIVEINWDRYEKDGIPTLPNGALTIIEQNGKLSVKDVTVSIEGHVPFTRTPKDADFLEALYWFNCSATLKGEISSHLGMHLWCGQIAMATFRCLNLNPLKALLSPHLRGVLEINRMGRTAIFGPDGILNVSGLTVDGIKEALKDTLGGMCYTSFKPRKPINESHVFARGGELFWKIVALTVDDFFEEHESSIIEHWDEIFYFSKNLVNHSVPYQPMDREKNYFLWDDTNEIDDSSVPGRVEVDGALRSVRPITQNKVHPEEGELEKLKQLCRHTLFMVTWWHWAVHTSQKIWLTNFNFSSLAPNHEVGGEYGGTAPEDAQKQISIARTLTDFEAGFLLDNPYGDIYPNFMNHIKEHREEFAALGYDMNKLMYGTII